MPYPIADKYLGAMDQKSKVNDKGGGEKIKQGRDRHDRRAKHQPASL